MIGSDLPADGSPDGATTSRAFLSYSRADFAFVQALYRVLAASAAIHPWLDVAELRGGGDWKAQIEQSIDAAAFFVLVVSRDSLQSEEVGWEWSRARSNGVPIVLVRIDSVRLRPEHHGYPVYDLRRRFQERGGTLRTDLEAGRLREVTPRLSWLPPGAVAFVLAANITVVGCLLYLWSVAAPTPVGASLAVRSRWAGDFTFRFTEVGVVCLAVALCLTVILQVGSVYSVIRRRTDPVGVITGLASAALVVIVGDIYVSVVPGTPLQLHLLLQYAFLALAIVASRTVWRHPDLQMRTTLGRMRRPEADDGDVNDLSAAHADREAQWVSRVLTERSAGGEPAGTVAVRHGPGDDDLARSIEALCVQLGFTVTDTKPDHVIVLVGPRTDLAAYLAKASEAQAVFVLVESLSISSDAKAIRRRQWVDLRRQEVGSFRDLARSLRPGAPGTHMANPPVDPSRFSAPLVVMWTMYLLIGQAVLGLQLLVIRLAVPQDSSAWRALSIGSASVYGATGLLAAIALVRHWWPPRAFRWCAVVSFLSAAVVDVTLLHDSASVLMIAFVVTLALLQLLAHPSCLVVSQSTWITRPAPGASLASVARTIWPSVAVGVLLLLLVTPVFLGVSPAAG